MEKNYKLIPLVILAGGRSSRMGTPKGLLTVEKKTWIESHLENYAKLGGKEVYLVLGHRKKEYLDGISWLKNALDEFHLTPYGVQVKVVTNVNPDLGPFSSLQSAGRELDQRIDWRGVFVLPVDQFFPNQEVWDGLVKDAFDYEACVPRDVIEQKGGHPVFLSADYLRTLIEIPDGHFHARLDFQLRALPEDRIHFVEVSDSKTFTNVNNLKEFWDAMQENRDLG